MNVFRGGGDVRPAAVAGRFYPADAQVLRQEVSQFLEQGQAVSGLSPKALIAPHAGYPYSGPIAGSAYAPWKKTGSRVRRVILIGPSHYEGFAGCAACSARVFNSPAGDVAVDREVVDELIRRRLVRVDDAAHQPEHALEVELPFLRGVLKEFAIVPILVGRASGEQVAELLEVVWGGEETGVVVSSDLSHYLDYETARQVDAETCAAVEVQEPDPVDVQHACGYLAIQGLLRVARSKGLQTTTIDLRNSGDTAGSRDRVVGYGAWVFADPKLEAAPA